ncbi:MerR family transcriptional regulator [Nonomuraea gerenzanensis]|uniref:Possible regulator n=1 Tax=Nonomuraea gerenzanensis TaxID=93944 RepID=A0A1M4ELN7_9ACTN|nr:MerR family transcriptional regulator [Nonomuraea gerenzanensis]UBU11274.1 MerR family transcriptional regulator [Nonomuraea gerenzanensis]SBO99749.1 Possible regulator [Nonomuraea gerenzanensis]
MDGDTLYSIGDLARRTGLTVKTVRFYSDAGIVPPTSRSPAGYRLYDLAAAARLDLVRTLRDLGLDLPTIRKVVDREASLPEVAAAHADALAAQIRTLRLRRAVLTVVARRGSTPEEMELMHELAKLSEAERRRLIGDFLGAAFGDLDGDPGFAGGITSMTPELPDDPSSEQVEAWVELAELSRDPDFRAAMRHLTQAVAAAGRPAKAVAATPRPAKAEAATPRPAAADGLARSGAGRAAEPVLRPDPAARARDLAAPALAAGIDPTSPEAQPYVTALLTACGEDRAGLAARLEAAGDPRRDRYVELLAVINGWPPPTPLAPALTWFTRALRAR